MCAGGRDYGGRASKLKLTSIPSILELSMLVLRSLLRIGASMETLRRCVLSCTHSASPLQKLVCDTFIPCCHFHTANPQVSFGTWGRTAVNATLLLTQHGLCVGYLMFLGNTLHDLAESIDLKVRVFGALVCRLCSRHDSLCSIPF